jgi:hypothetical protein
LFVFVVGKTHSFSGFGRFCPKIAGGGRFAGAGEHSAGAPEWLAGASGRFAGVVG